MTDVTIATNEFAASWAWTTFAIVWQSTLLAILAAVVCRLLRRQSPALRYWIWLAVAAKLLVAPLWTANVPPPAWPTWLAWTPATITQSAEPRTPWTGAAGTVPQSPVAASAPATALRPAPAPAPTALTWQAWLLLLWLAGIAAEVARTAWQFRRLNALLAKAGHLDSKVTDHVSQCSRQIGLRAAPPAYAIDADGLPMVCGPIRPRLLLPTAITASFDAVALRQVILHELAHIRRRDLATIWIIHAARTVYWFHPVAHWIAYRAGLERELACDQLALVHSGASPAGYARTLICAAGGAAQPIVLRAAARLDGGLPLMKAAGPARGLQSK
jgi:beta-lactamase regulating signal transducer with metallopeptidase domain